MVTDTLVLSRLMKGDLKNKTFEQRWPVSKFPKKYQRLYS